MSRKKYADSNILQENIDIIKSKLSLKQDSIQVSILPIPSASNLGRIYQYVGNTTSRYSSGTFYRCVYSDDEDKYIWNKVGFSVNPIPNATILSLFDKFIPITNNVLKAPLHDDADIISDIDIVSNYNLTIRNSIGSFIITVPIDFSGTDLQSHTNDTDDGYWMGIALPDTVLIDGYDMVDYCIGVGRYSESTLSWESLSEEDFTENISVESQGDFKYFYYDVDDCQNNGNDKAFLALRYIKNGTIKNIVIYECDFSNVTLFS